MPEEKAVVEFIATEVGERLDKVLAARFDTLSRSQIQTLIRDGQVLVNGQVIKVSYRLADGDAVSIALPEDTADHEPSPEAIPLDIVYEDDQVAVVSKPAGMVVHPAFGHSSGTLVNAVLARWPEIASFSEPSRAGIVHRLDKDTSGVLIVAKTHAALESLRAQFKGREVRKRYLALVDGAPETPEGVINAPIGRDPAQRKRMAVRHDGREAITEFRVVEHYADYSLVEVYPKTGRTHQIRVHLAFIGHPVAGDTVYGRRKQAIRLKRHFLHAAAITFTRPGSSEAITAEAPLPAGLENILAKLPR
ncbi:MAG: RluA family pseudouridine synthase [Anaerolineae bacterium]|nr:RluA family pseudouridine synthase [Anaerolineae bacterium]